MWPGVHPRLGLPLSLAGAGCYGGLLADVHPRAAALWWGLVGLIALTNVVLGLRLWQRSSRIADALAGRGPVEAEVSGEVDRVAQRVDDQGALSVWTPSLAVFFLASTGVKAAVERYDWSFAVPLVGIVLYAVLATVLLRHRNCRVRRWLAERPRTDGWRSIRPT